MPTSTASAQQEVKNNFYGAALELFHDDDAHVSFGHPGFNRENPDIIAFTKVRTEQETATLGPKRSRNEYIYLTVMLSCWRPGDPDDQGATTAAVDYSRRLEHHVRVTDTSLGGAAIWCFLEDTDTTGVTDEQILAAGRLVEMELTFKAFVRITTP